VRRQLDLVAAVGCSTPNERLSLSVPAVARRGADAVLRVHGLEESQPFIVVHPGATAPSRRYPPESFAAAADLLGTEGHRLLFTGSAAERELVAGIVGRMRSRAISLAGALGLAELCALIERATLLISNNTGPVHIAAALGIPVVDLYALTNPQHTPWGVPSRVLFHDVPCRLCEASVCPQGHQHCLTLVTPEQVAGAARELLEDRFAPHATG
jgi:ADP-heptose:LPS heptosyltransferase